MGVGEVGPVGNAVHAARVLRHHRVADVRKLAVLKHQEVCARVSDLATGPSTRQMHFKYFWSPLMFHTPKPCQEWVMRH